MKPKVKHADRIERLRNNLMRETFTFENWWEEEAFLCYLIEKITHQVVDEEYYAMKIECFKEFVNKDPAFKKVN